MAGLVFISATVTALVVKVDEHEQKLEQAAHERAELLERLRLLEALTLQQALDDECGICGEPPDFCYGHPLPRQGRNARGD